MKKLLKIICTLLVCLTVLPSFAQPVHAEKEDDGTYTIHSRFYVLTTGQNRTLEVKFNKNWFKQDARIYDHDLAKLSLGLATAAFRPQKSSAGGIDRADTNLFHFLDEAGFSGMRSDDYDKDPNMYTISTVMGHQRIGTGEDAFELIAVGVCGQGYLDEWESNFSIGTGTIHDGFSRSSQLVYDRIFGYIASQHLEGPYKIWISGFSRAAAVSNVTAARLCDSSMFDEHTVFAYTFATPRTTREPQKGKYSNIFNIVGKADPVPSIPFADWGYDRYGMNLMTPCIQTDSDYAEKRVKADEIYKELTGIDYWVNPEADAASRTILAYLQKICPTVDVYAEGLQDKLIRLWEDPSAVNILSNLLDIAGNPLLINEETRTEANGLMDYLLVLLLDFAGNSETFRRWNKNASAGANVLQAHTPELYISWVFSADRGEDLYTESDSYRMVYARNAHEMTLVSEKPMTEMISTYNSDGEFVYLSKTEDMFSAMIPQDMEYRLYIEPEEGETIEVFEMDYTIGRQSNDQTLLYTFEVPQGDFIEITYSKGAEPTYSRKETSSGIEVVKDELNYGQSNILRFLRSSLGDSTWRQFIIVLLWAAAILAALILFQAAYIIGRIRFKRKVRLGWYPKKTKYRALPFLIVIAVFMLFVLMQISRVLFPYSPDAVISYKQPIAVLSVLLAMLGWWYHKGHSTGMVILCTAALAGADIAMTYSLAGGALLHLAAYALLTFTFVRKERPGVRQIILFVLAAVISVWAILNVQGDYGFYRILAIVYMITASAMVSASFAMPRRLFMGSLCLFVSGCLVINNIISGTTFTSHFISLGIYYLAVVLIASTGTQTRLPHLIPEAVAEGETTEEAASAEKADPAENAAPAE